MTVFDNFESETKAKAFEFWWESRKQQMANISIDELDKKVARRTFERYWSLNVAEKE